MRSECSVGLNQEAWSLVDWEGDRREGVSMVRGLNVECGVWRVFIFEVLTQKVE